MNTYVHEVKMPPKCGSLAVGGPSGQFALPNTANFYFIRRRCITARHPKSSSSLSLGKHIKTFKKLQRGRSSGLPDHKIINGLRLLEVLSLLLDCLSLAQKSTAWAGGGRGEKDVEELKWK